MSTEITVTKCYNGKEGKPLRKNAKVVYVMDVVSCGSWVNTHISKKHYLKFKRLTCPYKQYAFMQMLRMQPNRKWY